MTDPALVAKKLALVETCLSDLERLARPAAIDSDVREPVDAVRRRLDQSA